FGLWADRFGGRAVFTATLLLVAAPTFWVSRAESFGEMLACALLFGLAGNSFSAGVAWNAAWFPRQSQGTALGVFGAGNVGAALTKFLGPPLVALVPAGGLLGGWVPGGWRLVPVVYAVLLVLTAAAVWRLAPRPDRAPGRGRPLRATLAPLRQLRVWQYSLDYVAVFGAYVALSLWLPAYYVDVYGLPLAAAAL